MIPNTPPRASIYYDQRCGVARCFAHPGCYGLKSVLTSPSELDHGTVETELEEFTSLAHRSGLQAPSSWLLLYIPKQTWGKKKNLIMFNTQ